MRTLPTGCRRETCHTGDSMNTPFRTGALALLTALPLAAASWPARILWHSARRSRSTPATVDSAAILGTAQYDGRPSAQLRGRLEHAVDVAYKRYEEIVKANRIRKRRIKELQENSLIGKMQKKISDFNLIGRNK